MNFKTNYKNILEEQNEINKLKNESDLKQKELNSKTHKVVLSRIIALRDVGESVVRKSFGGAYTEQAMKWRKSQFYGQNFEWLFKNIKAECGVGAFYVYVNVIDRDSYGDRVKRLSIDPNILTLSNRDFAKKIRKSIKQFKTEIEVTAMESSHNELKKAEKELEAVEEKIKRLQKLSQKAAAKVSKVTS